MRQSRILRPIPVDLNVKMLQFGEPPELAMIVITSGDHVN